MAAPVVSVHSDRIPFLIPQHAMQRHMDPMSGHCQYAAQMIILYRCMQALLFYLHSFEKGGDRFAQ